MPKFLTADHTKTWAGKDVPKFLTVIHMKTCARKDVPKFLTAIHIKTCARKYVSKFLTAERAIWVGLKRTQYPDGGSCKEFRLKKNPVPAINRRQRLFWFSFCQT